MEAQAGSGACSMATPMRKQFIESRGGETGAWRGAIEDRPDATP
jgi:hypothetical protein